MPTFTENLKQLPPVENIERLELYSENPTVPAAVIENKPGQAGSVAVYHYLALKFGSINPEGAKHALELYAEHTEDARRHPGKHPNIDRLFAVIEEGGHYSVKVVPKTRK